MLWIAAALILWTFNINKSDEIDPKTGLPFQYDVSDSGFIGEVSNFVKVVSFQTEEPFAADQPAN